MYPLSDVDPGVVESNHFEVSFARSKTELLHHTTSCFYVPGWGGGREDKEEERKGGRQTEEDNGGKWYTLTHV